MKVFVSYAKNNSGFGNRIMEIEHMPQNESDIRDMEHRIKDTEYVPYIKTEYVPYIKIVNIVPIDSTENISIT